MDNPALIESFPWCRYFPRSKCWTAEKMHEHPRTSLECHHILPIFKINRWRLFAITLVSYLMFGQAGPQYLRFTLQSRSILYFYTTKKEKTLRNSALDFLRLETWLQKACGDLFINLSLEGRIGFRFLMLIRTKNRVRIKRASRQSYDSFKVGNVLIRNTILNPFGFLFCVFEQKLLVFGVMELIQDVD